MYYAFLYHLSMSNDIKLAFTKTLRKLRLERNMTQEQLAEISGVDYKYFQKLEGQNPSSPTLATLEKLAKGLNISLSEFIQNIDTETKDV